MNIRENFGICEHIAADGYPFLVELVMDDHLGPTDAVVRCRNCQRAYLLEMLDWAERERVFRISALTDDQARHLIRTLTRGSCDLQRAGAEVQHLKMASAFAPCLILVDTRGPHIRAVVPSPAEPRLPGAGWRALPCDGSWVRYARERQASAAGRSNTAIVKG